MHELDEFYRNRRNRLTEYPADEQFQELTKNWVKKAFDKSYMYNFDWLGRPIIQMPEEQVMLQELIWEVKPDLIIETGIAHGGSLIFSASMLALLAFCDAVTTNKPLLPSDVTRKVLGIDIEIRKHNRDLINAHPLSPLITMIEGSSTDPTVYSQVQAIAEDHKKIMVLLDSNHTADHVLAELEIYSPMVSLDSYCVVFDTGIEHLPKDYFPDRPWHPGNSPQTAIKRFLLGNDCFQVDYSKSSKSLITASPQGYLRRIT